VDEVPRNTKAYQGWLQLSRETLDDRLEQAQRESDSLPDQNRYTCDGYTITRTQPRPDDDFFEIDPDNEVFHGWYIQLLYLTQATHKTLNVQWNPCLCSASTICPEETLTFGTTWITILTITQPVALPALKNIVTTGKFRLRSFHRL